MDAGVARVLVDYPPAQPQIPYLHPFFSGSCTLDCLCLRWPNPECGSPQVTLEVISCNPATGDTRCSRALLQPALGLLNVPILLFCLLFRILPEQFYVAVLLTSYLRPLTHLTCGMTY